MNASFLQLKPTKGTVIIT